MSWKEELPEDLQNNKSLEDVPDVATLAKRFIDTKSMVGKSLRIPGEDASADDWKEFNEKIISKVPNLMLRPDTTNDEIMDAVYNQLGRPENADKYIVPEVDTKGIDIDMSMVDELKKIAHKNGLNQKQFENMVKELTNTTISKTLELRSEQSKGAKDLMDEWGMAYNKNMRLAVVGAEKTKAPEHLINLLKSEFPPPDIAKYFHNIAVTLGDGEGNPLVTDEGSGNVLTPNEAQLQMSEMRRNREHPLNNPSDPGHKSALEKYSSLAKAAYPEART